MANVLRGLGEYEKAIKAYEQVAASARKLGREQSAPEEAVAHGGAKMEAMAAYARKVKIVDRRCALEVAQRFLERRIGEGDALEFFALLKKQGWSEMGSAVRQREVVRIASVPSAIPARIAPRVSGSGFG